MQVAKTPTDLRSLARAHTDMAVRVLAGVAQQETAPPAARVAAAAHLLDRGWGKAPTTHTGADGEGDIRVTIRHIVEGGRGERAGNVLELKAASRPAEGLPAPRGDQ